MVGTQQAMPSSVLMDYKTIVAHFCNTDFDEVGLICRSTFHRNSFVPLTSRGTGGMNVFLLFQSQSRRSSPQKIWCSFKLLHRCNFQQATV